MDWGTEPQREVEFVKKIRKRIEDGVKEDKSFGFRVLIFNTENVPFQLFKTRLEGLVSFLLVSPLLYIFKLKNKFSYS